MDAETLDAIDSLRNEIRRLGTSVNARFDTVESRFDSLDSRFDTLESRFDTLESSLAARIDDAKADMKRHFDIVAESTHDDVRIIAEGLVALNAKVDAMRRS
ncbi:MAG: hypothetical protein DMG02_21080 [Acidobacteria bacterium]|nr:MAG: hypothetical protein DMG02_21080 [Acidobacteriota bacterium]PYR05237.1 MAG: hypothetical protein DMF99_29135 [Acidobacteriota bacterium]